MGLFNKFLNSMQMNDDDYYDDEDDYFDDEDDYDDYEDEKPRRGLFRRKSSRYDDEVDFDNEPPVVSRKKKEVRPAQVSAGSVSAGSKVTPMRSARKGAGNMEVCVIKPSSMDDAREITETLLSNRTVVLNMEGLDIEIAQRIIDFASGSCYAINGNLQRIANYIYIITPASVDISGDFQNLLSGALGGMPSITSNF